MIYETFQHYALQKMASIVDNKMVSNPNVLSTAIKIIENISPQSVFCTIMAVDDNEIIFYWKAGHESLEISVEDFPPMFGEEPKNVVFTRHTYNLETQASELTFEQINHEYYASLNTVLVPMVNRVNGLNPNWKNFFA